MLNPSFLADPTPVVCSEWSLIGCTGAGQQMSETPIDVQPFSIGRHESCDLTLSSYKVSSRHAELMRVGDHLLLRDLGSTNGTYLSGRRVHDVTPVGDGDLIQFADVELRLAWTVEEAPAPATHDVRRTDVEIDILEPSWMFTSFEKLLQKPGVIPNYQPVVRLSDQATVGYEALARSNTPGLENPLGMFTTAELLGRESELSRECRHRGVFVADYLPHIGTQRGPVFLNTHPAEDLMRDVLPDIELLRDRYPSVAIVLEIHEQAFAAVPEMRKLKACLDDLAVDLAYDDFGAGQSRLVELLAVPPKYLKFDRGIIQAMGDRGSRQTRMVEQLLGMMGESGILTLAEGVETIEQADLCREVGFELAQGYLYGRPAPPRDFNGLDDTVRVPMAG